MGVEQGGGLSPEEMTNMESEAHDMNKMVDKGLLSRSEADVFDYEKEIEIPEALLSAPPKLSERMRKHVVSKFPPESFEPENIVGTLIHGTSIEAIRPLWLGEGKRRTYEGMRLKEPTEIKRNITGSEKIEKGRFYIHGDWTRLDRSGFNRINKYGERAPGALSNLQIFLLSRRSGWGEGWELQVESWVPKGDIIKGIVLSKAEGLTVDHQLTDAQNCLEAFSKGKKTVVDLTWKREIGEKIYKAREAKVKSFAFPTEPEQRAEIKGAYIDFLKRELKRANILNQQEWELNTEERAKLKDLREHIDQIASDVLSDEQIKQSKYFNEFLGRYLLNTLRSEAEEILVGQIEKYKKLLKRSRGENLYLVGGPRDKGLYLTLRQEANYIAHCMVKGVDKSKIVPVYDWDGKLLWPREEDVAKKQK